MPENNRGRTWNVLIFLGGLVLVFAAKSISYLVFLLLPSSWLRFEQSLEYGLDHLGLVVVAAMILKVTIEERGQREFVKIVSDRVKGQVETSIDTITEKSIRPLGQSIQQLSGQVETSINAVTEKSIRPLEVSISKLTERLTFRIISLLDPSLQKMLKDSVLDPAFIRPEYKLHLKLARLDPAAHPDVLKVFLGLSYNVKNVTPKPAKYSIEAWLEDILQLPSTNPIYQSDFTRIAHGDHESPDDLSIAALQQKNRIIRGNGVLNLRIQDVVVDPDSYLYVEIEGVQLMREQDHFVWNLITLTYKLDIIVELEGGLTRQNLAIFPREMHHIGHQTFAESQHWVGNKLTMAIDQVLLPFQGIEIRWSPIVPAAVQAALPAATAFDAPAEV